MIIALLLALPSPVLQEPPAESGTPDPIPAPDHQDPGEDPAPQDPEEGPPPDSPPEPGPDPQEEALNQMQEILRLIEVVRDDFQRLDLTVQDVREKANEAAGDESRFREGLKEAIDEAGTLIEDIDKLLESLPQMESQNPTGGSGGPRQRRQDDSGDQPNQDDMRPQDGDPEENKDGGDQDQRDATKLPDALKKIILFDLRTGFWGALPPQLQSAVENATAEDLPLRYRRWLEEYHRRSAERRP